MKKSAGILMYRIKGKHPEVLLVHPGGPFWKNKNDGTWSIPKGEIDENEESFAAAKREFEEETGVKVQGKFFELQPVKQNASKLVFAWALEGDLDAGVIKSNYIMQEWPPRSGKVISIPEVDKAEWFTISDARERILPGQVALLDQLERVLFTC
jgi:predicted NUDIX family NTP pyrophosphohydrolase